MRKPVLALLLAGTIAGGTLGVAQAAPGANNGKAGPNDHNQHGLCTAYFNGQKNGHDKNGAPGPFAALETAAQAEDDNGDGTISQEEIAAAVYDYCQAAGIGGGDNGRFDCVLGTQDDPATPEDESTDTTCTEAEAPGNS